MTVVPLPSWARPRPRPAPVFDIEHVLASIDTMAAQRPVAAQIVSVANSDDTSARRCRGSWPRTSRWPAG